MLKTEHWECDTCHEPIDRPKDGWVEWLRQEDGKPGRDLRLVHAAPASPLARRCQFDGDAEYRRDGSVVCDLSLDDFLGADGLMRLLALIAQNALRVDDVLELIKRLHVPGYEKVRLDLDAAADVGVFEPNTWPRCPHQFQIELVAEWIDSGRD